MKNFISQISPFKSIWYLILANIVLSFLVVVLFMHWAFNSFENFLLALSWCFFICITQWVGHHWINVQLNKKFSWIDAPVKRTIIGVFSLVIYAVVAFTIVQLIMFYISYGRFPEDTWNWILQYTIYPIIIAFVISFILTTLGFFRSWKSSVINAERLNTEMMIYKYESLRNQINPHFLFNSFNVLSDLVYEDQKMAVKFIKQLSDLFRYVLDSKDKELVPLKEEIDFINLFTYLLKIRFEEKLEIKMELNAAVDEYIVPMSLQQLVENAVKHNEVSEAYPLKISIYKKGNYIEVKNSLQIKKLGEASPKTGLKNIKQRFSFFTDKEIEIQKTENSFMVRIPILKSIEK